MRGRSRRGAGLTERSGPEHFVKGDLLGEVALFRDAPHSVTAIAVEHVTLLVIPAQRLESMVRANPELAIGLIRH